ncbi:MAG: transposase [Sphingobacteriales bacterium]|nr:MAG: transposase [Sphingobacteriales bacterium]
MSTGGYKIWNKEGVHFVTFAVVEWVDVFTRKEYRDIFIDSIRHCQQAKGLKLYSWCLMSNHVHMVISSDKGISEIMRDLKKFTSKQLIKAVTEHPQESRRDWMLQIFKLAGADNSRNVNYQFWRQDNQPKECYSKEFTLQKLEYIHNNPVAAGIVERAEDYLYSSARDYYGGGKGLLEVEILM